MYNAPNVVNYNKLNFWFILLFLSIMTGFKSIIIVMGVLKEVNKDIFK